MFLSRCFNATDEGEVDISVETVQLQMTFINLTEQYPVSFSGVYYFK